MRRNLREDVRDELLRLILRGTLRAGTNINEQELCDRLDVSRTPLREALLSLEHEGLLEAQPRRGWFVTELTPETVRDVYPMISALEVLALRSTDPAAFEGAVDDLAEINRSFALARDGVKAQSFDDRWHERLLRDCPNRRLLDTLASLKRIVHRYEFAYMSEGVQVDRSAQQHDAIGKAIAKGDFTTAARVLERNWQDGADVLVSWLDGRTD